jgi:DNA-binding NtrC family response regulator
MLHLAQHYLEHLGYHTYTAGNTADALKLLARQPIDLLFSDVVIPGETNGIALAEQATKVQPGLKVLLTSGYSSQVAGNAQESFAGKLLHKPYRRDELAWQVRDILDTPPAAKISHPQSSHTMVDLNGHTILVVDDEENMRELFKLNLEKLGLQTISARGGKEAIAIYQQSLQNGKPIDAIILDLNLAAGEDGMEIAAELRSMNPEARLIVASGHSESPEMSHSEDYGFQGAIEKDFDKESMKQVLYQVLS